MYGRPTCAADRIWRRLASCGMLGKKESVFDDFIAAAEFLIRTRSPTKSHFRAAPNGGLLMGTRCSRSVLTCCVVVCQVPLSTCGATTISYREILGPGVGPADDPKQLHGLRYGLYYRKWGTEYPAHQATTGDAAASIPCTRRTAVLMVGRSRQEAKSVPFCCASTARPDKAEGKPITKQIEDGTGDVYSFSLAVGPTVVAAVVGRRWG